MIYFVSPTLADFKRYCDDNNLPYNNGQSDRSKIIWIHSFEQLFGRKIKSDDEVVLGDGAIKSWTTQQLDAILAEIELRKRWT